MNSVGKKFQLLFIIHPLNGVDAINKRMKKNEKCNELLFYILVKRANNVMLMSECMFSD